VKFYEIQVKMVGDSKFKNVSVGRFNVNIIGRKDFKSFNIKVSLPFGNFFEKESAEDEEAISLLVKELDEGTEIVINDKIMEVLNINKSIVGFAMVEPLKLEFITDKVDCWSD